MSFAKGIWAIPRFTAGMNNLTCVAFIFHKLENITTDGQTNGKIPLGPICPRGKMHKMITSLNTADCTCMLTSGPDFSTKLSGWSVQVALNSKPAP